MKLDGVIGHLDWTDCAYCVHECEDCEVQVEVDTIDELVICWGFEPKEAPDG